MTAAEHGGGIDAAITEFGGARGDWLDLSTGINPRPYPLPELPPEAWSRLPDHAAELRLLAAARLFWNVPNGLDIVASPGTSALIAAMPRLRPAGTVEIISPTYGEHARAFRNAGWQVAEVARWTASAGVAVAVNPNNPDGKVLLPADLPAQGLAVIDESFADSMPGVSLLGQGAAARHITLKSFGKFWGLAGLRLGFAICPAADAAILRELLGPWPVSGPALATGAAALEDTVWRDAEIVRLQGEIARLDRVLRDARLEITGGTPLFRLVKAANAAHIHRHLARNRILTRKFLLHPEWLRIGLPASGEGFTRLQAALERLP